jgi:hypothetical protein
LGNDKSRNNDCCAYSDCCNNDFVSCGLWRVHGGGSAARAPVAVSGNNIYTAWNNASATLHGAAVFFTKSSDGGKTFANTMVLSPPNTNPKISVIRENVSIGASGSHLVVTWWTNETGALNPVIRTSNDGGNTFGNLMRLNSTFGGINK